MITPHQLQILEQLSGSSDAGGGADEAASSSRLRVLAATWLSREVMAIAVCTPNPDVVLRLLGRDASAVTRPMGCEMFAYRLPRTARSEGAMGRLILARLPAATRLLRIEVVETPAPVDLHCELEPLSNAVDLKAFLRTALTPCDADTRSAALDFMATICIGGSGAEASERSSALTTAHAVLRERLPAVQIRADAPLSFNVDAFLAIDDRSFYARGWLHSISAPKRLTAVSARGIRIELLPRLYRYRRPDMESHFRESDEDAMASGARHGFVAYFETPVPVPAADGWVFELVDQDGSAVEAAAPPAVRHSSDVRNLLLADIALRTTDDPVLVTHHISPAIHKIQARRQQRARASSVHTYGRMDPRARVSVIVPLYGRIDFLEHQLAQFVHDPELCVADLIYVLDSPELADALRDAAARLHALYRVPFRIVIMQENGGFAIANNTAAAFATGEILLLLNSDVLPAAPGWLGQMEHFYRSKPQIGALGPKLLYEDDTIQHAGMHFAAATGADEFENLHDYKGMHRSLSAACVDRKAPAITGACLMVSADQYRQVGGLGGMYVQGDFEDSDLCLRLAERGRENWYVGSVELYHLEGQSYPSSLRQMVSRYNRWLHTHLWRSQLSTYDASKIQRG